MKRARLILAAFVLSGATVGQVPIPPTERLAYTFETALRERFDDPASVALRDVRHSANGRAFCGEVNGRDRHGVYTGFREFIVYGRQGAFMVLIAEDAGSRVSTDCG